MHKPSIDRKTFINVLMQKSETKIENLVSVQDYALKNHTSSSPQRQYSKKMQILQLGNQGMLGSKYRKIVVNQINTPRIDKFMQSVNRNSHSKGKNLPQNSNQRNLSNQEPLQFEDMNMAQVFIYKARSQWRDTARSPEYRRRIDIKPRSTFGQSKNCYIEINDRQYRKSITDSKVSDIFFKKVTGQSIDTSDNYRSASFAKYLQLQSPLLRKGKSDIKQQKIIKRKPRDFQQIKKNRQQILEEQRRNVIKIKKQLKQCYGKPINPPPNITAYSYIVYQPNFSVNANQAKKKTNQKYAHSHKVHIAQNSRNTVQVASLTKIMTCVLAIDMCKKYGLNAANQIIKIGKFQSVIGGTSARIQFGEIYTLQQILYGLMLPSGNDASLAIAVWGGRLLLHQEQKNGTSDLGSTKDSQKTQNSEPGLLNTRFKKKDCYKRFLTQMNNKARQIGLQKTNYANSHGLVNFMNKSCSFDIAILSQYAMNNQTFKKIVSTQFYQCSIKAEVQKGSTIKQNDSGFTCSYDQNKRKRFQYKEEQIDGQEKQLDDLQDEDNNDGGKNSQQKPKQYIIIDRIVNWENTHRLLHQKPKQYLGIKTGITTTAGPCLSSCVRASNGRCFIIVVLSCKKMNQRFRDTQILRKWIFQREGLFVKKNTFQVKSIRRMPKDSQSQESQDD